jgi:hypothetical protein
LVTFGLQLQIFIPSLSLAFEYQGETHYWSTPTLGLSTKRQRNDALKVKYAADIGITLIAIPYWWDRSTASLSATIRSHRMDVQLNAPSHAAPIPATIPRKTVPKFRYNLSAAQEYDDRIDPTGW